VREWRRFRIVPRLLSPKATIISPLVAPHPKKLRPEGTCVAAARIGFLSGVIGAKIAVWQSNLSTAAPVDWRLRWGDSQRK
jgi:hypothetical protein